METRKYVRLPVEVEAVKITGNTFWEIAAWAQALVCNLDNHNEQNSWMLIDHPFRGLMYAHMGDYIIYNNETKLFECVPRSEFIYGYKFVPEDTQGENDLL